MSINDMIRFIVFTEMEEKSWRELAIKENIIKTREKTLRSVFVFNLFPNYRDNFLFQIVFDAFYAFDPFRSLGHAFCDSDGTDSMMI